MKPEKISLFYKEGGSNKVYHVTLEHQRVGWIVNFAYGRKGNALVSGTKTLTPIPYEKAKKIYDKLVSSKTCKGYTSEVGVAPFTGTVSEARDTGFRPQLLNEVSDIEMVKLINDDNYCAQQKFDGRRRGIIKEGENVIGTNRKGLSVDIPDAIKNNILKKKGVNFILDGEAIGNMLYVFDILELDGIDMKEKTYDHRYITLLALLNHEKSFHAIELVESAYSSDEKRALYNKLVEKGAEGIVFKKLSAKYTAGRPYTGGDQIKFKFHSSCSCIVEAINEGKNSVSLLMRDEEKECSVPVGNLTIYPNQKIPKPGTIVEVKYLYYRSGGALYQPVYLGPRDDLDMTDCSISQLKHKSLESEAINIDKNE